MTNQIYGIDYELYYCGGIGNVKLARAGKNTILFENESEMLSRLAELKYNKSVDNIFVFTTLINRVEYKIK